MGLPKGWLNYCAVGGVIEGTPFIPFKVPLSKSFLRQLPTEKHWTLDHVFWNIPRIGMVIDLTNSTRYYNPQSLLANGVIHKKIFCEGRGTLPGDAKVKVFMDAVAEFSARYPDKLIGVHCTHGLNRTGYMICRYMMEKLSIPADTAISAFATARGHPIERPTYLDDLTNAPSAIEARRHQSSDDGTRKIDYQLDSQHQHNLNQRNNSHRSRNTVFRSSEENWRQSTHDPGHFYRREEQQQPPQFDLRNSIRGVSHRIPSPNDYRQNQASANYGQLRGDRQSGSAHFSDPWSRTNHQSRHSSSASREDGNGRWRNKEPSNERIAPRRSSTNRRREY